MNAPIPDSNQYYTPQWCIDAIGSQLQWRGVRWFLEPCAGDNRIVSSVIEWAPNAEILRFEIGDGSDYLSAPGPRPKSRQQYTLCLTNPPFSTWIQFAEKANRECKSVVMLGRLSMLASQKRRAFWDEHPPSHLWVLSKRPSFEGPSATSKGTDNSEYAWFGWNCERIARDHWPGIYWI